MTAHPCNSCRIRAIEAEQRRYNLEPTEDDYAAEDDVELIYNIVIMNIIYTIYNINVRCIINLSSELKICLMRIAAKVN